MVLPGEGAGVADAAGATRRMWTLFEPVHAVVYFAPEARAAFEGAGLRGFWRGYFAGRAAPLGAAGPAVVTASFFNFAPAFVARAIPGVWELISPAEALRTRLAAASDAFRGLLAGLEAEAKAAADLLWRAAGPRRRPDPAVAGGYRAARAPGRRALRRPRRRRHRRMRGTGAALRPGPAPGGHAAGARLDRRAVGRRTDPAGRPRPDRPRRRADQRGPGSARRRGGRHGPGRGPPVGPARRRGHRGGRGRPGAGRPSVRDRDRLPEPHRPAGSRLRRLTRRS